METVRARLYEAYLRYPPGQEVHTAASGRIDALHELFLELSGPDPQLTGIGEVRANVAFITGTAEAAVVPGVIGLLRSIGHCASVDGFAESFCGRRRSFPKICQALVENALVDLQAKQRGMTVAEHLGGSWSESVSCNQCVFWGSDADMHRNLAHYLSLGFRKIKLRVGIGSIEDDERRLASIRAICGNAVSLAVDANGAWGVDTARRNIDKLSRFGLDYVEQPTHKGDWPALEKVAADVGVDVMIDEGLQTEEDVARVCANRGRISAHLKIVKAGGAAVLVEIGRQFDQNGVSYVVGQMNEGSLATAIAVQVAMALNPRMGELYGALGLTNDPGSGVIYRSGSVSVARAPGTGVKLKSEMMTMLWDSEVL